MQSVVEASRGEGDLPRSPWSQGERTWRDTGLSGRVRGSEIHKGVSEKWETRRKCELTENKKGKGFQNPNYVKWRKSTFLPPTFILFLLGALLLAVAS